MSTTNKIDILCYYDQHHKVLFDNFFAYSYEKFLSQQKFKLLADNFISKTNTEGEFLSSHWSKILIDRYNYIISYAKKNPQKWAIFSDVDVVFLSDISLSIDHVIDTGEKTNTYIFYMKEIPFISRDKTANGGFFVFKCCESIIDYFTEIQSCTKKMKLPNDQECINSFLKDHNISYGLLPNIEYLTNNGPPSMSKKMVRSKKVRVFHATSAPDLKCKMYVLYSALHYNNVKNKPHNFNLW